MQELLPQGFLLLEDGTLFLGRLAGPTFPTVAEVVFTTSMSGYQETFTDPSYQGQIVVMTAPQIGNYGINNEDGESAKPQVAGVVCRELSRTRIRIGVRAGRCPTGSKRRTFPCLPKSIRVV